MALPDYPEDILVQASKLPPAAAIEFLKSKGFEITFDWTEVLGDVNNRVFQVAKSMNMDVLQDIRGMVQKALDEGLTFNSFQKELEPKLAARGWWGRKPVFDPEGNVVDVQLGSPARLKTIYRTNTQSAYNAGRWSAQKRGRVRRPWLMLIEMMDAKTKERPNHWEASGSIQKVTSDFWKSPNSWYPPNGYNCRARVRSLTDAQAKARGAPKRNTTKNPDPGFGGTPSIAFKPVKKDFDSDIWKAGQEMEPQE